MAKKIRYDRDKFKGLVHAIARKAGHGANFAPDEIAKALWMADARSFLLRGKPITGATYRRSDTGLNVRGLSAALTELSRSGAEGLQEPVAITFTESETADIEWSLRQLRDPRFERIWAQAAVGEEIPYHAILALRMHSPDGAELEWAKQQARELAPS